MKKLLFVVHTLQIGGAERVLLNILKNINKEKYDITVLALVNDGIYIEELKKIEGVKYKYLFTIKIFIIFSLFTISKFTCRTFI